MPATPEDAGLREGVKASTSMTGTMGTGDFGAFAYSPDGSNMMRALRAQSAAPTLMYSAGKGAVLRNDQSTSVAGMTEDFTSRLDSAIKAGVGQPFMIGAQQEDFKAYVGAPIANLTQAITTSVMEFQQAMRNLTHQWEAGN
jgi:hypothetical protein